MIIKNEKLINCIENAILNHDNQFWREEDTDKKIDFSSIKLLEDGESVDIPEDILRKLEKLRVTLYSKDIEGDELQDIISELSQMLDIMNLKSFSFSVIAKGNQYTKADISFLEHLNDSVETLEINGVDLSQEKPSRFERFKNLRFCSLEKCNISDPTIISEIKEDTIISLRRNEIAPEYYEDAIKLIQSSGGKIDFSVKELETIKQIYSSKKVEISDYLRLMNVVHFDNMSGLTVKMEDDFDFESNNIEQLVSILNEKNNITLSTIPENLSKLDSSGTLKTPTKVIIRNASELSIDDLSKHPCISAIQMSDGKNTEKQQGEPYTREEYDKVRREIDKIISQVDFPEESDPNREKKIFAQIYSILGKKITYDYNAISQDAKNDERLQTTCRNLLGGLLENTCVCAGYADILRNVLACSGIYSEYIGAMPDIENGVKVNLNDPGGHAWNLVMLDGKKYWTDLTWDASNIKVDRYPLKYCLKSTQEFKHDTFKKRIEDEIKDPCLESISDEEQIKLFTGRELDNIDTTKKQENKNIGYLSSCVMEIADSGLTSETIRKTANEVGKCTAIKLVNELEVADGRD